MHCSSDLHGYQSSFNCAKDFLEKRVSQIHGDEKIRLDQQIRKYFNLKAKFTKLKDDHKSLLGNLKTQTNLYD